MALHLYQHDINCIVLSSFETLVHYDPQSERSIGMPGATEEPRLRMSIVPAKGPTQSISAAPLSGHGFRLVVEDVPETDFATFQCKLGDSQSFRCIIAALRQHKEQIAKITVHRDFYDHVVITLRPSESRSGIKAESGSLMIQISEFMQRSGLPSPDYT